MERVQSNEYFGAVQSYFVDHKDPAMVYTFLLNTLWADKYKLPDKLFYQRVDMLKMTNDCLCFYTGTECVLVLCAQPQTQSSKSVS